MQSKVLQLLENAVRDVTSSLDSSIVEGVSRAQVGNDAPDRVMNVPEATACLNQLEQVVLVPQTTLSPQLVPSELVVLVPCHVET